MNNTELGL